MAEWLKKQAEREAEKEQRRLERLQRKLAEPKHQFTDTKYQQQCHDLSERLEDSVLKGPTLAQRRPEPFVMSQMLQVLNANVCVCLRSAGEGGQRLGKETKL